MAIGHHFPPEKVAFGLCWREFNEISSLRAKNQRTQIELAQLVFTRAPIRDDEHAKEHEDLAEMEHRVTNHALAFRSNFCKSAAVTVIARKPCPLSQDSWAGVCLSTRT